MQSYSISRPLALVAALVALQLTACSQPKPVAVVENEKESLLQFDNGKLIQFKEEANPNYRHIPCDLPAVDTVVTNSTAFAALTKSGDVITWGDSFAGGDSREVTEQLKQVKQIVPVKDGFAALRQDGAVVYWGNAGKLSLDKALQARMTNITKLFANREAIAALDANGKVHTWGYGPYGGNSLQVQDELVDVVDIFAKGRSFVALKKDGSAVVWGQVEESTNMKKLLPQLTDVAKLEYFQHTYAALKKDGSVVSWGWRSDTYPIRSALKDVVSLTANNCAFAILSPTGDAHFWGDGINCGVDWIKKTDITGVKEIISVGPGFLLLRDNATPQILADDTDYAYLFGFHDAQEILNKYWQQGSVITRGSASFVFTRPDGKVVPVGYRANLKNVEQLIERIPRLTWLAQANDGFVGISEKGEWVSWSMNLGMFDKSPVQPADSLVVKPLEFTPAAQCETPEQRQAILSQARPQRKINWSFD
ncbi:hypothetical protein [Shewanella decolorationis]|uniref:Rcc1 blip-ii superfamily lipoprotein n=1 Tax=Shewanella decolorationis S12 TaxID=1353536 RepID=A0ABN0PHN0_9GAMM|nr:hypothetical protein [Shewanella decolorationis]ESE39517.1 rcc1 blip-ii superfamily lipoprotein [Shewanella decolorationis S12]GLR33187.1 hypothetical protein GCM10007922_27460 [Shewanella decolorationis]